MKKRTSSMSRRIVSLLMSMVLTLTLVTPAAFATEVVDGSGTTIVAGNTNPADPAPGEDSGNNEDKNTEDGKDEQPTEPGDEDKNPGEGEGDVNASSNEADTQEGEGTDTPVVAQRTVTLEKWNKNAAYDVKIVIPAATSEPGEGETTEAPGEGENAGSGNETLSTEYTGTDEKITLKLTATEDYKGEAIYIKSSADEVVAETTLKLGDDGTLEYVFTGEETDITLYYGTQADFVSAWYGDGSATKYTIRSAEELAYFAQLVNGGNDFSGKTVTLARDIDLSAVCHPADEESGIAEASWTPIGLASAFFTGTFNGQHHTTSSLFIAKASNNEYAALFGKVGQKGEIIDLIVSGTITATSKESSKLYVAGIVAVGCGTISGCKNEVVINITGKTEGESSISGAAIFVGGIVGDRFGSSDTPKNTASTVVNCLNSGAITVTDNLGSIYIGGISARFAKTDNCWNTADVTVRGNIGSPTRIGGIIGQSAAKDIVINCYNNGAVTAVNVNNIDAEVGGIAGKVGKGNINNCYNWGDVTGNTFGGIAGSSINGAKINNSYYICKLNDTDEVAMKYVDNNSSEQPVTYEEATQSYKVGENTLVKTLNDNKGDGLKWFVNISEGITKPIFVKQWDGTDHPDYVPDGSQKEVYVTYDPNGGGGSGTSVSVTVTLNEDGTVKTPGSHTILTAEAAGVEKDNNEFKDWNTAADGSGTSYDPNDVISVSEDLTLYAQWQPLWKGSGTESDPYQIENEADWLKMQKYAGKYNKYYRGAWFALMNDITLDSSYEPFNFAGNLKGNHHAITVNIPKTTENGKHSRGLFGSLAGGTDGLLIENLTIAGSVTAFQYAGGLAGSASGNVTLENVTNTATVCAEGIGTYVAGGLIGHLADKALLTVKNCRNEGAVTGHTAGGLVGSYNGMTMMDFSGCTNSGTVHGENAAAGLLGFNARTNDPSSSFTNCSNTGEIIASGRAAGIAVLSTGGKVEGCTNSGAITGDIAAGILCSGVAKRSVNTGKITGKTCGAGIAANNNSGYTWYTMEFCANFGEVTAVASVNGLLAFGIAGQGKISNCFTYNKTSHVPISGVASKQCTVSDSYYLANSDTEFPSTMGGTPATLDDFASGKVAWGVDGGTGAHVGWWTQDTTKGYPKLLPAADKAQSYYRAQATCGTGGAVTLDSSLGYTSTKDADNAVYGPAGTSVTIKATPKDNTFGLKSLTWTHNGQTDVLPAKGTTNIVMPAESNVTIHAEFASVGTGGNGGYYYGGSGDGTGTGDKDDEGLQDGLNMDVEYDIKGLVLGAYAEWGSNGGNKSFQKWLEENPNVVRALLTNSLDNMATAAVGKKTDEAKDLAALLLASLNEHTGVDGKDGDTIAKALQKYIDSGSEEVFSAWLTGGGGMASGTYESIYGQYASSLAALADRLYSKWEASGTSMTFPVWLDSQQVTMESLSENAEEPDAEPDDTQTTEAPEDVPDGQDTEGGASGNSVWEVIGTVVRENPILVWSIVAVIAALIIVGAVRRYHKVKRDEHDEK